MKEIELTQGQVALVDDWWFDYLNQWNWYARWCKYTNSFYAVRNEKVGLNRKTILMHRVVNNTPDGMKCDHINHDTLNNQECNLRCVNASENNMNSRPRKNNRLGERCIRFKGGKYNVRISKENKFVFDSRFDSLEEARSVRDEMLIKIHGKFAYTGE